jgi:hypothetical protein
MNFSRFENKKGDIHVGEGIKRCHISCGKKCWFTRTGERERICKK